MSDFPWVCTDCKQSFTVHHEFIAHMYLTHWQDESVERIKRLRTLEADIAALRDELAQAKEHARNAISDYIIVAGERDQLRAEVVELRASLKQHEEWQKMRQE